MALLNLNRAQDAQIATLMLSDIAPEVYPTLPAVLPDPTPEYLGDVTYVWPYNGIVGDDVNSATANATGPYEPKNQGNKASILGLPLAVDVTTPRGWIDPREPYGVAPTPTLTSLDPASRDADSEDDVVVVLNGTNFMPSSQILWNGVPDRTTYISPTQLSTIVRGGVTTPSTADVSVSNDGIVTAPQTFTFSA